MLLVLLSLLVGLLFLFIILIVIECSLLEIVLFVVELLFILEDVEVNKIVVGKNVLFGVFVVVLIW